jgi:hypothetical protein
VSRISPRPLLALAAVLALSCGGSSSPPKKAATPASGDTAGGLHPLSSEERASDAGTPPALPPGHPPLTAAPTGTAATSAAHVAGTIELSPRLQGRFAPTDVLSVIA